MNLGAIGTAMVTPFNNRGDIDYEVVTQLVTHLIENGTDSLIINGTTGESPTLSDKEKEELLAYVIKEVDKRVPVIAGTGSNDTKSSIYATQRAQEIGADGVMLVVPYYNKPDQVGMYTHFKAIADSTYLPVLLYNVPGRSGVNLLAETVIELSHVPNIQGIKEASGDLGQMSAIIAGTDASFSVYSGDDSLTLPLLAIGGRGVVSVASHVVGLEMQQMIHDFHTGQVAKSAAKHRILLPLFDAIFSKPNPVPIKYLINKIGILVGNVRSPLVGITQDNDFLDEAIEIFRDQFESKKE